MVVGDMRLPQGLLPVRHLIVQRRQHHRQVAHGSTVAAIPFADKSTQATVQHVALDAAAAGVADIYRARL